MMYPGVKSGKKAPVILCAGIFLLQMISCVVCGQLPDNFVQDDFQHKINLYDFNGRPIGNDAIETKGSPLFLTKWKLGWLRLADNRFYAGIPLELDLQKQKVHYRRSDGSDIEVEQGQVKQVLILDTIAGAQVIYQFACGFAPIDNQTAYSFYLVLDSGRVSFLESMQKEFRQDKDDFESETKREYRLNTDFYVLAAGKMTRIKKDSKFFLELTSDKHDQMGDYLNKNRISFKSIENIRQFIHYYNGLP